MRLQKRIIVTSFLVIATIALLTAQGSGRGKYRVMFYNVENLFDTLDAPDKDDSEFLPNGDKKWDSYRYWKKIRMLYQVIAAAGEETSPDIIGFCEVENEKVLADLINNTPLSKYSYSIIHKDSPDRRGIDVALITKDNNVEILNSEFYGVDFPKSNGYATRDILGTMLKLGQDTLHVFVNHWPSRRGGEIKSEPRRIAASKALTTKIDSVKNSCPNAKIIAMGDFNDEPHNKSIQLLKEECGLINLSEVLQENCNCGTYKYRSEWNMIDQFLITKVLMESEKLHIVNGSAILDNVFLLLDDEKYGGDKVYRTYLGPRYMGGYSDHLPIILDLGYTTSEKR